MKNLSEHDIRPPDLVEGQQEALRRDIAYLLAHAADFGRVRCPVCDAEGVPKWEKKGFEYEACPQCATVFMNPRPSENLLHHFYKASENYAYWNQYIFPASEVARRESIFIPRVDRLTDILVRCGAGRDSILEIGAGFGTFCQEVQARGLFDRVVALEMTPDLAQTCRERGLEVVENPIEDFEVAEGSFDVIVAFEVLEHIHTPKAFLASVARCLRTGGILVLSCPNVEGFDVMVLGTLSDTVDHEHLNYFNPRSLRRLLLRQQFDVKEIVTPGQLDADIVRNKVLEGRLDLSGRPFLKHVLVEQWETSGRRLQAFLADAMLSTHMWAVAQRH